MSMFQTDASLV